VNAINIEDVLLTGILAKQANVSLSDQGNIFPIGNTVRKSNIFIVLITNVKIPVN
jgi:hypothetical protein